MVPKKLMMLCAIVGIMVAAPSQAQTANNATGFWDSASSVVTWPFRYAWNATTGLIGRADREIEEEIAKVSGALRNDFRRFEELISRTGFRVSDVSVSAGLIPEIELNLEIAEPISDSAKAALRAELSTMANLSGKIERGIILLLLDADKASERFRPAGYRLSGVTMRLVAIIPEMQFQFSRDNGS